MITKTIETLESYTLKNLPSQKIRNFLYGDERVKQVKGITLIALVITIIILLILAGITISSLTGENGLFEKVKQAVEKHKKAEKDEQDQLDEFYKLLGLEEQPPANTQDTEAGTVVALEEGWGIETVNYYKTTYGTEVKGLTKVSTVYAVSAGNGVTIPVPKGFYYVGGTKSSGVVISDDSRDQNKYVGQEEVPAGAVYNSDGTVKTYTDEEYKNLSNEDKKKVILGNQFVWIPCTENEYTKKDWGKSYSTWETQTNSSELAQIQKYGGFYRGRYEAGTSNISLSTGVNFASQNTASDWVNDNFSIRDGLNHTAVGKITQKAGEIPYYGSDYITALKLSNNMYSTQYVQSGLVTGTMWDAMLKFIAGNDDSIVTSSPWGNYTNGQVTYIEGQGRYAMASSSGTSAFTKSDGTYHYGIKTTAISEDVKKKNLYDVAGNLWEWTQEAAYMSKEGYIVRGGSFDDGYSERDASYRAGMYVSDAYIRAGIRPVLYIK